MQTEVFVVISGMLEVHAKQEDGTDILLAQRSALARRWGKSAFSIRALRRRPLRAVEFSQLWRIADDDLMGFMKENPGAGNVLLRTLASILAQRLRQMNPKAFGLSTYAVVDSPELPPTAPIEVEQPADEPELPKATLLSSSGPTPKKPIAPTTTAAPASYQDKALGKKTQIVSNLDNLDELEPI